jgi:peroxiredoxin (alkyl hydroperoxide reductase subunit C)
VASLVLYFYPGSQRGPDGEDVRRMDGIQHGAFRVKERELAAFGFQAIGISSQSCRLQREAVLANRIGHRLLSDPELLLARELELPTLTLAGALWYRRITLVLARGQVVKVFFPVREPAHNAAQVIAWICMHGGRQGAGPDAG